MLAAVLWTLAALLALFVAALASPVRIRLDAASAPERRARVWVTALGGLLPAIRVFDSSRRGQARRKRRRARKRDGGAGRWRSRTARGVPALIGDLLACFRIVHVRAEGAFGLEDPADTGMVYGMLSPLIHGLPPGGAVSLDLRPDFGGPRLDGRLDAAVEVTPIRLIPPALRFAWRAYGQGGA